MTDTIIVLPGDCIGPEITEEALRVLDLLSISYDVHEAGLGAAALRETGKPLADETRAACLNATAILKAPIGDPAYDDAPVRPEVGLFELRKLLDVYVNLRPAQYQNVDLVIVRELLGGLYYGARGTRRDGTVFDTCEYHPFEVTRVVRAAAELARTRRKHLASVDKANVLDTSKMWRTTAEETMGDYPDVQLEHLLVDNVAMLLIKDPARFDVIVTDNMFGDILSDEAAALAGGLGMAGSASLSDAGPGLFEPVHGSAPDIAGSGIANPIGMLRATALMLRHGLQQGHLACALEAAITEAVSEFRTPDIGGTSSTHEIGDAVLRALKTQLRASRQRPA